MSSMLPIKSLTLDQTTLWAKAYNDCNKSTFKSGENHVWIRWYSTLNYFKMGLAKDGPPGGGGKSEIILNVNNVDNPEFIQIVGPESKTPKIQIKYNIPNKFINDLFYGIKLDTKTVKIKSKEETRF